MRLRLEGSFWPSIEVVELTPTGMLVETPLEPSVGVGHAIDVEINGRGGTLVVDAVHDHIDGAHLHYSVRVIEHDPGLIAALGHASSTRTRSRMRIIRRYTVGATCGPNPSREPSRQRQDMGVVDDT
jgi:hypothetical protein